MMAMPVDKHQVLYSTNSICIVFYFYCITCISLLQREGRALSVAAGGGHYGIVKLLLSKGGASVDSVSTMYVILTTY